MQFTTFDLINYSLEQRGFDFSEEKLIIRSKSLNGQATLEVPYEKIKRIQYGDAADTGWVWLAFPLFLAINLIDLSPIFHLNFPFYITRIAEVLAIFGIILFLLAMFRHKYCAFLDADRNTLAFVGMNKRNREYIAKAVTLIKKKNLLLSETDPAYNLSDKKPIAQLTLYDLPYFLQRSIVRFYDDRMVDQIRNLVGQRTIEICYDELGGESQITNTKNTSWNYAWSYWMAFLAFINSTMIVFFPNRPRVAHWGFSFAAALLLPLGLMTFTKVTYLVFCNKDGKPVYWLRRNRTNRNKMAQMAKLIKERNSSSPKDSDLSETSK